MTLTSVGRASPPAILAAWINRGGQGRPPHRLKKPSGGRTSKNGEGASCLCLDMSNVRSQAETLTSIIRGTAEDGSPADDPQTDMPTHEGRQEHNQARRRRARASRC